VERFGGKQRQPKREKPPTGRRARKRKRAVTLPNKLGKNNTEKGAPPTADKNVVRGEIDPNTSRGKKKNRWQTRFRDIWGKRK